MTILKSEIMKMRNPIDESLRLKANERGRPKNKNGGKSRRTMLVSLENNRDT